MDADIKQTIIDKVESVGSATASLLWPYDFEAYMVSMELTDANGKTLDYLSFPIMPENLSIEEIPAVNIRNTFGGVAVVSSELYTPKTITLRGNFGRNIRFLSRNTNVVSGAMTAFSAISGIELERSYNRNLEPEKVTELSHNFKTGYGATKALQSIVNRSYGVDKKTGAVNKLYFYNLSFGESYVVKVVNFRISQSLQSNMLWNYDLTLRTISPLSLDKTKNASLTRIFSINTVQMETNALLNSLIY